MLGDDALIQRASSVIAASQAKSPHAFARKLAELSTDPVNLFSNTLESVASGNKSPNLQFFAGLITGADIRDPQMARECVRIALQSELLRKNAISLIGSGKLQPDDLKLVSTLLKSGDVEPWQCASLSHGRGLDHLEPKQITPLVDALVRRGAAGLWTALDIILMYLYPDKALDAVLEKELKAILRSPKLFDQISRPTMDGHHLEQAVSLLAKQGKLSSAYVSALVKRMLSLIKVKDSSIFFELDEPVREVFKRLIPAFPSEIWNEVSTALLTKDPLQRHRLQQLLKSGRDNHFGPGPLFQLPEDLYLSWVRIAPIERASRIAEWLPIANKNEEGSFSWHPATVSFVAEFGAVQSVLQMISLRMHPSGWMGSIVPYLEPWIPLLRSWLNHSLIEVRVWAQQKIGELQEYIRSERKRDEEDVVRQ
jgi:hypothetical protein